jgi:SHS2 domain-containing protein
MRIDQVTAGQSAVPLKYEYIEHTADLGFKAYGATQEELFVNAAEALFEVLVSLETIQPSEERAVKVEAQGLDGLMVSWLSDLLYLFETQHLLLNRFCVESIKSDSLEATVHGEVLDPARHEIKTCVKAVTYHKLYVTRGSGMWESQIFLDL